MLQLKETLDQRMGCVIVGPSGCGKSTLWSILRHAMIKCGQAVNTHVVNPKSMPRQVRSSRVPGVLITVVGSSRKAHLGHMTKFSPTIPRHFSPTMLA